jgi:hypothetical protein
LVLAGTLAMSVVAMSGVAAAQTATVNLGSEARVRALYSYPNNCADASVCTTPSLDETVKHYLDQSLTRDGYADSKVVVRRSKGGNVTATFTGAATRTYPKALQAFHAAGDMALADARTVASTKTAAGDSGNWPYGWRFFLPVGLAMVNHPTVELLHFPPDYSLTEKQDYLNSATTNRWANLLTVNGVPVKAVDAYQAIVDINPIAAPANDGKKFDAIEGAFSDYIVTMLNQWTANAATPGRGKAMVAFGSPVRVWLAKLLGHELAVDQVAMLTLPSGTVVPVIGANHPSQIFYTAWNDTDPKTENFAKGMSVMTQDLIAACWQAGMGAAPSADPQKMVSDCTAQWKAKPEQVCMLLETTIYDKSVEVAKPICATLPTVAMLAD